MKSTRSIPAALEEVRLVRELLDTYGGASRLRVVVKGTNGLRVATKDTSGTRVEWHSGKRLDKRGTRMEMA